MSCGDDIGVTLLLRDDVAMRLLIMLRAGRAGTATVALCRIFTLVSDLGRSLYCGTICALAHGEMSMLRRVLFGLLAVGSLTLVGCAHSPQSLNPQPKLNAQLAPVGHGQQVVVRVVDGRPSPTLGTRGGLYPETSSISVEGQQLVPQLQAQAEAAVRLLGFTPVQIGNGPQLTVTLAELKYQSPKEGLYVTEANISSTFRADVQNNGHSYNGRYAASLDQRFGMAPNEETNTKLIGDVLSDALTRVFQDQTIGRLLGQ